jgi:hypothetical protein
MPKIKMIQLTIFKPGKRIDRVCSAVEWSCGWLISEIYSEDVTELPRWRGWQALDNQADTEPTILRFSE